MLQMQEDMGFVKLLHYTDESFNSLPMIIQKEIGISILILRKWQG